MSDYVNGYVEWRGRETVLQSQYGVLDKETGEHLVAVENPHLYFDGNDMDFVESLPNQKPVESNQKPPPHIKMGANGWVTQTDRLEAGAKITITGEIDFFGADPKFAEATVNGKDKIELTVQPDGKFSAEFTITNWERSNILKVAAQGLYEGVLTDISIVNVLLNDLFSATKPESVIDTVMDMKYVSTIEYTVTPNRARIDATGIVTAGFPGDVIRNVLVDIASSKTFKTTKEYSVNENGLQVVKWYVSIPYHQIDSGKQDVTVIATVNRNGNVDSTATTFKIDKI